MTCVFCHRNVELVENLQTWFHLEVPVNAVRHKTNLAFPMTEKSRAFAINHALVLGFPAIGCSHVTASKVLSFLRLYTWSGNLELTNLS